jgi:nucleotide-binding universal stress UspA family protein
MIKLNASKIVIPVDFSKTSLKAIKHGAFIAKLNKGELILLNVQKKSDLVDIFLPAFKLKDPSVVTKFIAEKLEALSKDIRKEYGIKVTPLVSMGSVTSEIVNIADENKAGLIVMGTHGGDSDSSILLGSNAYRVLTKAHCPVITVRANTQKIGYGDIVMPIDSSYHTRQKVMPTLRFAEKFASKIHVLGILGKNEQNYKHNLEVILGQIEKLGGKSNLSVTTKIVTSNDPAAQTIKYANKMKADLISIMSDQRAAATILLGNYAHQLINDSKIPVLCFKPEKHDEQESFSVGGLW